MFLIAFILKCYIFISQYLYKKISSANIGIIIHICKFFHFWPEQMHQKMIELLTQTWEFSEEGKAVLRQAPLLFAGFQ